MFCLHGRREMHEEIERTEYSLSMMNQPDELAQICLSPQIENSAQLGMMVSLGAHLNEENTATECVDNSLKAFAIPPLDCLFEGAAGAHYPERYFVSGEFLYLRHPGFLPPRKVQITPKQRGFDLDIQKVAKVSQEPVYEVERRVVTPLG